MSKLDKIIWRARHKVETLEKHGEYFKNKRLNQVLDAEKKIVAFEAKKARELAQEDDGFRGIDIFTSMAGRGLGGQFQALQGSIEPLWATYRIEDAITQEEPSDNLDATIWQRVGKKGATASVLKKQQSLNKELKEDDEPEV